MWKHDSKVLTNKSKQVFIQNKKSKLWCDKFNKGLLKVNNKKAKKTLQDTFSL